LLGEKRVTIGLVSSDRPAQHDQQISVERVQRSNVRNWRIDIAYGPAIRLEPRMPDADILEHDVTDGDDDGHRRPLAVRAQLFQNAPQRTHVARGGTRLHDFRLSHRRVELRTRDTFAEIDKELALTRRQALRTRIVARKTLELFPIQRVSQEDRMHELRLAIGDEGIAVDRPLQFSLVAHGCETVDPEAVLHDFLDAGLQLRVRRLRMVEQHVAARHDGGDVLEALALERRLELGHLQPVATDVDRSEQGDIAHRLQRAFALLDLEHFEVVAGADVVGVRQHHAALEAG